MRLKNPIRRVMRGLLTKRLSVFVFSIPTVIVAQFPALRLIIGGGPQGFVTVLKLITSLPAAISLVGFKFLISVFEARAKCITFPKSIIWSSCMACPISCVVVDCNSYFPPLVAVGPKFHPPAPAPIPRTCQGVFDVLDVQRPYDP